MIRVGISGCGAVAQRHYGPALRLLSGKAILAAAFDTNFQACRRFAALHGGEPVSSFDELLDADLDLLIVASPPIFHADQSCSALLSGTSVLCEKPMALSVESAERMAEAAQRSGRTLAIGMVRRLLPQARLIGAMLARQVLGELNSIEIFEGGPFDWPVASPSFFDPAQGCGILEDVGIHVLDLMRWWCGDPSSVAYADDAMGGVAANCRLELAFGSTRVTARLSRDWYRPNLYRFVGEAGHLNWAIHESDEVEAVLDGEKVRVAPARVAGYPEAVAEQIRAAAVGQSVVSGADALTTLRLLDRCRQVREPLAMEWL